ncbi:MAG TPA: molybdopterin-dependent oxidoreductase [Microthrixaceae bacterium]|nr:molybdopterin-dependent oxidoreductase [Microthrixaceae bacterium]
MTRPSSAPTWAGALAGIVAAGCGIAVGELVAGVDARLRGPIAAVGDRVIDTVPAPVKTWAIDTFGTNDKAVLLTGVTVLLAVFAAVVGVIALRRSLRAGLIGVGLFAGIGVLASLGRGGTGWARPVPPIVAGLVAGWVLVLLTRRAAQTWPAPTTDAASPDTEHAAAPPPADAPPPIAAGPPTPAAQPTSAEQPTAAEQPTGAEPPTAEPMIVPGAGTDRRRFLRLTAGLAGAAVAAGGVGRWLQSRAVAVAERLEVVLPRAARPLPPVPAGVQARGAAPFITPNADFYRIDTALVVPRVSHDGWTLGVVGRVRRPLTLTYAELLDRPMVEADITISCVSNEVGGDLIGTARWLGCRLDDLLDEAGIDPSADQVVGRSVDGFTAGFPTALLDGRPALVAVGMNGEPLPIDHGYPARLIVPGVYGYVSATKWLAEIELTRFDEFDAYWIPRGWSQRAPIKTQSRIDTPHDGAAVAVGEGRAIAGVAWAMDRRISAVEVRISPPDQDAGAAAGTESDPAGSAEGEWQPAVLADELNDTTWRQWHLPWTPARAGRYTISVRATDGTGATQPEERTDVVPDGATGWHTITVTAA